MKRQIRARELPDLQPSTQLKTELAIIKKFRERLLEVQKELPPEFAVMINERFWDLI